METTQATLCEAIKTKKVVVFNYDWKSREVEPWLLGYSKTSKYQLVWFQISWYSSSWKFWWKYFDLDKIENLKISGKIFNENNPERKLYNPKDKKMEEILCCINKN